MAIEVESTLASDGHFRPPSPVPVDPGVPLPPDGIGYRLKRKVLGPPLHSEEIEEQRLGKPTALAVFASDNLSSSAYATEEILHVLVPAVGLAAFSLVVPITIAMVVVFVELWAIAWIQNRFLETPFLRAALQVVVGGGLVFAAGALIGGG